MALRDQRIGDGDAKPSGEMIVTGSGTTHGLVARAGSRNALPRDIARCVLHEVFEQPCDGRTGEAMVAVASLLLDR